MIRRILLLSSIGAAALAAAPAAMADPHLGGCTLNGTANFGTPLTTNTPGSGPSWTYTFSGTLSNCLSTSSIPTGGTVSAGVPFSYNGYTVTPPKPTGTGGCSDSTTAGDALVKWGDGTISIIKYSTTGAAAAVALTGDVEPSVTWPGKDALGNAVNVTVTSTAFSGDSAGGGLAFEPADPTACAGAGVASAGIQGEIGTGNDA